LRIQREKGLSEKLIRAITVSSFGRKKIASGKEKKVNPNKGEVQNLVFGRLDYCTRLISKITRAISYLSFWPQGLTIGKSRKTNPDKKFCVREKLTLEHEKENDLEKIKTFYLSVGKKLIFSRKIN
jgi:hypothetical protein